MSGVHVPTDAQLVEEARAGRREAFDRIVDRHWSQALALAYQRTRNWGDAEDAAQDAFILAFRKLDHLRDPARFGGWLFTIVVRSCVEIARRRPRRPALSDDLASVLPDEGADDDSRFNDRASTRTQIHAAIASLPEHFRPVVLLRYGQGLPVKTISRMLGVPVGTVVSQIFRANRVLRSQLKHLVSE